MLRKIQILNTRVSESPNSVVQGLHQRFTTKIEAGIKQNRTTRSIIECFDESIVVFILFWGNSLDSTGAINMNNCGNLFFDSFTTLDSVHHEGSIFHVTKVEPFISMLCQNRSSKRTEVFSLLNQVDEIFTIRITRIIKDGTVTKSTRTCLRLTLEHCNDVLRCNQINHIFISSITYNAFILVRSVNDFIQTICMVRTIIKVIDLCGKGNILLTFLSLVVDIQSSTNSSATIITYRFNEEVNTILLQLIKIPVVSNTVQTISSRQNYILLTSQINCLTNQFENCFLSFRLNSICHVPTVLQFSEVFMIMIIQVIIFLNINMCSVGISRNHYIPIYSPTLLKNVRNIFIGRTIREQTHGFTCFNSMPTAILSYCFVCFYDTCSFVQNIFKLSFLSSICLCSRHLIDIIFGAWTTSS